MRCAIQIDSVQPIEVADSLEGRIRGIEVDRRKISIDDEIRTTGDYTATVKLHPEHSGTLKLQVVPESLQESI